MSLLLFDRYSKPRFSALVRLTIDFILNSELLIKTLSQLQQSCTLARQLLPIEPENERK